MNYRNLSVTEYSSFLANENTPHNCMCKIDYDGKIEEQFLLMALKKSAEIHPALNFCLDKNSFSLVKKEILFEIKKVKAETEEQLLIHYENEANTPFDLERAPLIRVTMAQVGAEKQLWIVVNHLICDGISLANFPHLLFKLINEFSNDNYNENLKSYGFESLDALISEKNFSHYQNNLKDVTELKTYTKSIMFNLLLNKKNVYSVNTNILAASGMALCNLTDKNIEINYCIPVNIRPYIQGDISNNQFGFYSSWIDFNYIYNRKNNFPVILEELSCLVLEKMSNNEALNNVHKLINTIGTDHQSGILDRIKKSDQYSMCISNVGKIEIQSMYKKNNVKIKAIYLGLNSFYRNNNCFLLIATGVADKIFFTLQYNIEYVEDKVAHEFVRLFIKYLTIIMSS